MVLGCTLGILTGACLAIVSILTRKLSDISFSVALFYAGAVSVFVMSAVIYFDSKFRGTPLLTLSYSMNQYIYVLLAVTSNFAALSTCTIAN